MQGGFQTDLKKYFEKSELIPAIVQESGTGEILMLAYMNEESLKKTLETGYTWFFSRSRQKLWNKGETSGHVQRVKKITADCDLDTLLVEVEQTGAACHTGNKTCFFNEIRRFE
ncbi:MAG TPA: phosphoribosyl-AMP cyclohydrolase [Ruminiclostridium sp.]|nr:phosphoribosyl-AMP cyclohydrolase [Ruminiclostridium sp.]